MDKVTAAIYPVGVTAAVVAQVLHTAVKLRVRPRVLRSMTVAVWAIVAHLVTR